MSKLFSSKCPKCSGKLSPFYMKQNCPHCGVDLLYYQMDAQLEADAKKAQKEVDAVNHFVDILRKSVIASPWHIVRFVLFFTPLLSMCLPMYWAGSKSVSLISVIVGIVNYGLHLDALIGDLSYFIALLSMVLVILLSLAVIICSMFSATKCGYRRNMIFSTVNTLVLVACGIGVALTGGIVKAGFFATLAIYALEFLLHFAVAKPKTSKKKIITAVSIVLCVVLGVTTLAVSPKSSSYIECPANVVGEKDVTVVSFNVASPWGSWADGTDTADRCVRFANYMNSVRPDIIGTQEMNSIWMDELKTTLADYDSYGKKRGGDSDVQHSEFNTIYWQKDKYTCIGTGTFWLSDTPDEESRYTYTDQNGEAKEAGCHRVCSYVILQDNNYGKYERMIVVFNTHLDNSSEEARIKGIEVINEKMQQIIDSYGGYSLNVVLMGDFNTGINSPCLDSVKSKYALATDDISVATYQQWGYSKGSGEPIDFIFTNGKKVSSNLLDYTGDGYISDHYGIFSQITFE